MELLITVPDQWLASHDRLSEQGCRLVQRSGDILPPDSLRQQLGLSLRQLAKGLQSPWISSRSAPSPTRLAPTARPRNSSRLSAGSGPMGHSSSPQTSKTAGCLGISFPITIAGVTHGHRWPLPSAVHGYIVFRMSQGETTINQRDLYSKGLKFLRVDIAAKMFLLAGGKRRELKRYFVELRPASDGDGSTGSMRIADVLDGRV